VRPASYYRPELDALRFFAFLTVFLHHALWRLGTPHSHGLLSVQTVASDAGGFGMCLFFLLSSFLITELLRREYESTGGLRLSAFYLRRILRIWPLYFLFLIPCALVGRYVFRSEPALEPGRLAAFLGLVGNWYTARHGWTANPIAPLWSISLEEQFYLIWPPLMWWFGLKGMRVIGAIMLPVSMLVVILLDQHSPNIDPGIWVNSGVQFQFFALGALLALFLKGRLPHLNGAIRFGLVGAALALWAWAAGGADVFSPSPLRPFLLVGGYEAVALGTLLLFLAALGLPQRHIPGWIVYLGKISYGLYIFHYLCLGMGRHVQEALQSHRLAPALFTGCQTVCIGFALTVVLAALSYRWLETPFLRLKERIEIVRSRPV
jgi:peptidoglycan/LPS O-acetylase OafA/YrhL